MLVKKLQIAEINATNLDHARKRATLVITFVDETPLTIEVALQRETEPTATKILQHIKKVKTPQEDTDDGFLSGVIILNIVGDDELHEKIAHGLYRVYQKMQGVSTISTAREYMTAFNQLKTAQENVYRKGSSTI